MTPERFAEFLDRLAERARQADDVVGLVGFGSTADRTRADEGSDHDFAWLVRPGAADRYRYDLSWLPDAELIAASAVEHHGGVKVIYDDGHRLEFGISDVAGFSTWAGAPAHVIVGDDEVRASAEQVTAHRPEGAVDPARELVLFLTQLLSGVGRARRGEVQSASGLIRGEAVAHLLRAAAALRAADDPRLDPLDPRRRIDAALPTLASRIEAACRLELLSAAAELLRIAESEFGEESVFPARGFAAARIRLGG
jgi:hypothetical protein